MAITLKKIGNTPNVPFIKYVTDTTTQMNGLDVTSTPMGSECFVIEESKNYILNSSKQWVENAEIEY